MRPRYRQFREVLLSLFSVTLLFSGMAGAADLTQVSYNMAWLPQGSSIGPIVAKHNGTFKKLGLEVKIVRGYGGNRTANEVDQGEFTFGFINPVSLVLNKANGGNLRMIGSINSIWPAGLCYNKAKHNINSINDLQGLVMGGGSASPVQQIVPTWLELNKKPENFIKLVSMSPSVVDASLISGQIDLAECWLASNLATILRRAHRADVQIGVLWYRDYGLDAYGSGFATREDFIKKNPDAVRAFLKGAYKGYEYAMKHPKKATAILTDMFPTVDPKVALRQVKAMKLLLKDPESRPGKPLGYMYSGRMESTISFINKAFDVHDTIGSADIYTNKFLSVGQ